jgi:hypothetical protein
MLCLLFSEMLRLVHSEPLPRYVGRTFTRLNPARRYPSKIHRFKSLLVEAAGHALCRLPHRALSPLLRLMQQQAESVSLDSDWVRPDTEVLGSRSLVATFQRSLCVLSSSTRLLLSTGGFSEAERASAGQEVAYEAKCVSIPSMKSTVDEPIHLWQYREGARAS